MSKTKWYWTLQVGGWTLYGLLGVLINSYFFSNGAASFFFPFLAAALMLLSTHSVRWLIKSKSWLQLRIPYILVRIIPIFIFFSAIINIFNSWYMIQIVGLFTYEEFSIPVFFLYVLQNTIYFMLWSGIYLSIHYFRNYKSEEIEKWKLQSALKDAELIALKAQINPHFLFNALNNIRALILEDQMKAREMVAHLSDLMRYSIQFSEVEEVTLKEELEIVKNYLELESIHYEKRLKYHIDAPDKINNIRIPPMVIQLLVENAIKHGISQEKEGGKITITIWEDERNLNIEVGNPGILKPSEREGIGIKNATERIKLLFDKEPEFALVQEGSEVKSRLTVLKKR